MSGVAKIYDTTLEPSKEAVVAEWITGQPWYRGGATPTLTKVGAFRFVDPEGEVGMETLLLREQDAGPDAPTYQVPVTYRSDLIPGVEPIGSLKHGVLGLRYVNDGALAPRYLAELIRVVLTGDDQAELSTGEPATVTVRGSGRAEIERVTMRKWRATADAEGDDIHCEVDIDGRGRSFDVRLPRQLGEIILVGSADGELAHTLDARWVEDSGAERSATLAVVRAR